MELADKPKYCFLNLFKLIFDLHMNFLETRFRFQRKKIVFFSRALSCLIVIGSYRVPRASDGCMAIARWECELRRTANVGSWSEFILNVY